MVFNLGMLITEKCNIQCRHCMFGDGDVMHGTTDMPVEDMKSYVDQMAEIADKEKIEFGISLSGGEPFLLLPQLLDICRYARSKGAVQVSTMTNGFWGEDEKQAEQMILSVKAAGLRLICVSMDDFHQEHIPLSSVLTVLKLCRRHHMAFSIKCVVTKKTRRLADVIGDLGDLMLDRQITVQEIPCCPQGRAALVISKEDLFYQQGIPEEACTAGDLMTILPGGEVYPCCGTGWSPFLCIGNAKINTLKKIYEKMKHNPVIPILYQDGPAYFLPFFEKAGQPIPKEGYVNSCSLCQRVLTHPAFPEILPAAETCWRKKRMKQVMSGLLEEKNFPDGNILHRN